MDQPLQALAEVLLWQLPSDDKPAALFVSDPDCDDDGDGDCDVDDVGDVDDDGDVDGDDDDDEYDDLLLLHPSANKPASLFASDPDCYDDDDDDDDDDKEVEMHNSCKCTNHLPPFQFELTLQ